MGVKKIFENIFKADTTVAPSSPAGARTEVPAGTVRPAEGARPANGVGTPSPVRATQLLTRWQTEKGANAEGSGQYVFVVDGRTNKTGIAEAFRALTGVKPVSVSTGWVYPRQSVRGKRRARAKKAVITVKKGVSVNFPQPSSSGAAASAMRPV